METFSPDGLAWGAALTLWFSGHPNSYVHVNNLQLNELQFKYMPKVTLYLFTSKVTAKKKGWIILTYTNMAEVSVA